LTQLFHIELLEAIAFLGLGRKCVLLAQRHHLRIFLKMLWIDTSRGRKQKALNVVLARR